jgi:hypothetical protein
MPAEPPAGATSHLLPVLQLSQLVPSRVLRVLAGRAWRGGTATGHPGAMAATVLAGAASFMAAATPGRVRGCGPASVCLVPQREPIAVLHPPAQVRSVGRS